MDSSDPNPDRDPAPPRESPGKTPGRLPGFAPIGITAVGALAFATWLHAHLGDFTAERGWRAGLQVTAISLAFGAMLHLIVEAAVRAVQGLQNDLDALTARRDRRSDPDNRT